MVQIFLSLVDNIFFYNQISIFGYNYNIWRLVMFNILENFNLENPDV